MKQKLHEAPTTVVLHETEALGKRACVSRGFLKQIEVGGAVHGGSVAARVTHGYLDTLRILHIGCLQEPHTAQAKYPDFGADRPAGDDEDFRADVDGASAGGE